MVSSSFSQEITQFNNTLNISSFIEHFYNLMSTNLLKLYLNTQPTLLIKSGKL